MPPGKDARQIAEKLVASVLERRKRVAEEFYSMGKELRLLARPDMFGVLGYRTFGEMLEGRRVMNRMTALKLISVVDAFPVELATTLGLEKAYALVRYAEATPALDVARVLAERDVVVAGKRVSEATVREIAAETKRLRGGGGVRDPKDPAAKEARGAARALQAALRKAGGRGVSVRAAWEAGTWGVRVEMSAEEARAIVERL